MTREGFGPDPEIKRSWRRGGWGPGTARAQTPGRWYHGHRLVVGVGWSQQEIGGYPSHYYVECCCGWWMLTELGSDRAIRLLRVAFYNHALKDRFG